MDHIECLERRVHLAIGDPGTAGIDADGQLRITGTTGNDVITLDAELAPGTAEVVAYVATINGTATRVPAGEARAFRIEALAGADRVTVGPFVPGVYISDGPNLAEDLFVDDFADTVIGGTGDDTLVGEGGSDLLYGGPGNDLIDDRTANVGFLYSPSTLDGGRGDDRLFSADGGDTLFGGQGNDVLDGGLQNGGAGSDLLRDGAVDYSDRTNAISAYLEDTRANDGEAGEFDRILNASYILGGAGNDVIVGSDQAVGNAGNDFLQAASRPGYVDPVGNPNANSVARLDGGAGDDTLIGGPGDDFLDGGPGADVLRGGAGDADEVFYADRTADLRLTEDGVADDGEAGEGDNLGSDIEVITAGQGNDYVIGGPGNDTIMGLGGNDSLFGANGNDLIYGDIVSGTDIGDRNPGDDLLGGGNGDDTLIGGLGADVLAGNGGRDLARYPDRGTAPLFLSLDQVANDGEAGEGDYLADNVEDLEGGLGADLIVGNAFDNRLYGLNSRDTIYGNGGNDTLDGGRNPDLLFGGPGRDTLLALDGFTDYVDGGPDADTAETDSFVDQVVSIP